MIKRVFLFCSVLLYYQAHAQIAGQKSFEFLNTPSHARLAALGGVNVSLADRDVNFVQSNPALVSDSLAGWGSASYQLYVADIGQSTFSYADTFNKLGLLALSVQHIGYGTIQGYDETGLETGEYKSGETALIISKSHGVNNFRLGISMKGIFSSIAGYRSSAVAVDIGGVFVHPEKDFTVGLAIKNAGFTISEYTETSSTQLPFDVQAGITLKPEHMPLRFSLTAYNLAKGKSVYGKADDEPGTLNKLFRHINFGAEILVSRNVNVLLGYNYLIHQELKMENSGGGAGFSFGFSARVKSFEFVVARNSYITGVGGYTFTLASNVKQIITRKKIRS